jgi:hypothetical protein
VPGVISVRRGGGSGARIRLDKAPLSREKILKKVAKHAAWLLIAALTGGAWITYFNDAPTVTKALLTGNACARPMTGYDLLVEVPHHYGGRYLKDVALPLAGQWEARVHVVAQDGEYRLGERIWLEP